jgi:hypothetical protein
MLLNAVIIVTVNIGKGADNIVHRQASGRRTGITQSAASGTEWYLIVLLRVLKVEEQLTLLLKTLVINRAPS